jgi:hypothetical protein
MDSIVSLEHMLRDPKDLDLVVHLMDVYLSFFAKFLEVTPRALLDVRFEVFLSQ